MPIQRVKRMLTRRMARARTEASVRLGLFRRLTPLSRDFGLSRGKPIDRFFVEDFLSRHRADIKGRVLEGGGYVCYARRFGGDRLEQVDIMYPRPGFPDGTLVADLATGEGVAAETYDCLLLTFVYTCIYDVEAAVRTSWRALKPGGVLLASLNGIGQTGEFDQREWGVYWRFTEESARRLFGDAFGPENVRVETYGNVFAACAFLQCLAAEDLTERELHHRDPDYPVTITVRATKSVGWAPRAGSGDKHTPLAPDGASP